MSWSNYCERPRPELDLPKPAPHAFHDGQHTRSCILCGTRQPASQYTHAPRYGKAQVRCTDREACKTRRTTT